MKKMYDMNAIFSRYTTTPLTNGDIIRNLSNDALAKVLLAFNQCCCMCTCEDDPNMGGCPLGLSENTCDRADFEHWVNERVENFATGGTNESQT